MTRARPVTLAVSSDLELHTFVVDAWEGTPSNLEPDEHDALAWFRPAELAALRLAHPALVDLVTDAARVR